MDVLTDLHVSQSTASKGAVSQPGKWRGGNAWYALAVLTLVYACQFMDRQIMAILLEPIRREFHLTDTQLGLLTGFAFSISFALAGIPLGILADRVNRKKLVATLLLVWSACTALCGLASSYPMLLISRVTVGAAESGGAPTSMAMLGDAFPARRRSLAASVFQSGGAIGGAVAFVLGGFIAEAYGWRAAFFLAFLPGLIVAFLLFATVREPPRGAMSEQATGPDKSSFGRAFVDGLVFIRGQPALIHVICGMTISAVGLSAFASWVASFYVRTYDVSLSLVGTIVGATGIFGALSHIATSYFADWLGTKNRRWPLQLSALCSASVLPIGLMMANQPTLAGAITFAVMLAVLSGVYIPIAYAGVMNLTPPNRRAQTLSIGIVLMNMIGYGFGPLVTGVLSDAFGGALSLALGALSTYGIWSAAHFLLAARAMKSGPVA